MVEDIVMVKAIIFDMFETLVTHYSTPLYFSEQMAEDIGITPMEFQKLWRASDAERTLGFLTFEEIIEEILKTYNCYSKELFEKIVRKRIATKQECFSKLHTDIIPMLEEIRGAGKKLALISNCFSEEALVIRQSVFPTYFDRMYLSYEVHKKKPDTEIFQLCARELNVTPEECLYIGDGGSQELETAAKVGMKALQAGWYLKQSGQLSQARKETFQLLENPMDVLGYI